VGEYPEAVVLDLVQPIGANGRGWCPGREAGLEWEHGDVAIPKSRRPERHSPVAYYRVSNEYCVVYGLSRATVYKLIREGTLRTVKVGGRRLFPRDAAEALLAESK
jgi:excisionase family DNA binding protein